MDLCRHLDCKPGMIATATQLTHSSSNIWTHPAADAGCGNPQRQPHRTTRQRPATSNSLQRIPHPTNWGLCATLGRRLAVPPTLHAAAHARWIEGKDLPGKPQQQGNQILFYTHTLCPYAQRVHLTLLEKVGIRIRMRLPAADPAFQTELHRGCRRPRPVRDNMCQITAFCRFDAASRLPAGAHRSGGPAAMVQSAERPGRIPRGQPAP